MLKFPIPIETKPPEDPYGTVARCYSICLDPVIIRWKRKALKMRPPREEMRVLDVGCGTGAQLNLYRPYGCTVFGIDISAGMIAAARRKYRGSLNLCRANAARMPYSDQAFELILLSMMLHEISPDIRSAVLAEAARVLKDSGRILIIDYSAARVIRPIGRLFKGVITLIEMAAGHPHFENYRNFLETGGLLPLLKKHGLTVEGHEIAGRGNIGLYNVRKNLSID